MKSYTDKNNINRITALNALREVVNSATQQRDHHRHLLGTVGHLRQKLKDGTSAGIARYFRDKNLSDSACEISRCQQMLTAANRKVSQNIFAILNRVNFTAAGKITTDSHPDALAAIEATQDSQLELLMKQWACERALGEWHGDVTFDVDRLAKCMATTFIDETRRQKMKPSILPYARHYSGTIDRNVTLPEDTLTALKSKVLAARDYQLMPWEMLRFCTEESDGNLVEAMNVCYESLRILRGNPDVTRKLADIRGDRARGGDNSGDWYHFFGTGRLAMAYGRLTTPLYLVFGLLNEVADKIFVNNSNNAGFDLKEYQNDLAGIAVGRRLHHHVAHAIVKPQKTHDCDPARIFRWSKK